MKQNLRKVVTNVFLCSQKDFRFKAENFVFDPSLRHRLELDPCFLVLESFVQNRPESDLRLFSTQLSFQTQNILRHN